MEQNPEKNNNSNQSNPRYKDHVDYSKRRVKLHRWNASTEAVESTGLTGDARGDESLYKPSNLGKAWCDVKEVLAGDNKPFTLFYQVGSAMIETGWKVIFWMAGQGSLGDTPQRLNEQLTGYFDVISPQGVEIKVVSARIRAFDLEAGTESDSTAKADDWIVGPISIGFEITKGTLTPGQLVKIQIGHKTGFNWKKLAGKKEFKVIIDPGNSKPRMRLPEPVVIRVKPLEPERLEVLLPMGRKKGVNTRALFTLRDKWDNRVPVDAPVKLKAESKIIESFIIDGKGQADIGALKTTMEAVKAECSLFQNDFTSNPVIACDDFIPLVGDLHCHDFNSTAEGYTADVYIWARDEKKLDFISVPIQVHRCIDNEKWTLAKHFNEYFLDEGKFVTLLAFEWQHSHYGDKVIHYLGGDMPFLKVDDQRYSDVAELYKALRKTDALIVSHHVGYELDLHVPGTDWQAVENDIDRIAEIWSMHGSSEGYDTKDRPLIPPRRPEGFMHALKNGIRMGVAAGSDTHTARPGGSIQDARPYYGGLCGLWAKDLTRRELFKALYERRTWALTGDRIILDFRVNGYCMGSEAEFEKQRKMELAVWAPEKISEIMFLRNGKLIKNQKNAGKYWSGTYEEKFNEPAFYNCRVKLKNGHLAVSSPVWIG